MTLGSCSPIAFVATTDAERAKAFYGEKLGLRLVSDEGFAVVFDSAGTMLRVSKVESLQPAPYTVLGWSVPDIEGAVDELSRRGVTFERFPQMDQDSRGIWGAGDGTRVAWFRDPDGNVLSVTQFREG